MAIETREGEKTFTLIVMPTGFVRHAEMKTEQVIADGDNILDRNPGTSSVVSAEALADLLPDASLLLAQISDLQARASAQEKAVRDAEAGRDAEKARADAETAKVVALEARVAGLTATRADPEISDRQLFQQLAIEGEITEEEAEAAVATGTIPEAMMALVQSLPAEHQFGARMMLKGATTIKRRHPMTALIGQLYGKDNAWLDRFFAAAGAL